MESAAKGTGLRVFSGPSWTTDAPFRETDRAIAFARELEILAVEMEAAALYAFAAAKGSTSSASLTSRIRWGSPIRILRKEKPTGTADALRLLAALIKAADAGAFIV